MLYMNINVLKISKYIYIYHNCDNQQPFKGIIEAAMVSTPKGFTENSPISLMTSSPVKKVCARKSLCMFTNVLDVNKKIAYRQVRASKSKRKAIKYGNTPWALKQKQKE